MSFTKKKKFKKGEQEKNFHEAFFHRYVKLIIIFLIFFQSVRKCLVSFWRRKKQANEIGANDKRRKEEQYVKFCVQYSKINIFYRKFNFSSEEDEIFDTHVSDILMSRNKIPSCISRAFRAWIFFGWFFKETKLGKNLSDKEKRKRIWNVYIQKQIVIRSNAKIKEKLF